MSPLAFRQLTMQAELKPKKSCLKPKTLRVKMAEDCAGLGAATRSLIGCLGKQGHADIEVDPVYASESDDNLRKFLKNKFKVVTDDAVKGCSAKLDKQLRVITCYAGGTECQPFSKGGNNAGKKDKRASTTKSSVRSIQKRKPSVFILEQVPNIKSMTH